VIVAGASVAEIGQLAILCPSFRTSKTFSTDAPVPKPEFTNAISDGIERQKNIVRQLIGTKFVLRTETNEISHGRAYQHFQLAVRRRAVSEVFNRALFAA
jgi:hypothetical protein